MAYMETAFQTSYRQSMIAGFEQNASLLRGCVTTEAQIKGNQAVFLVADSGGATATTRGVNGRIVGRPDNNNQYTCTLVEYHDKVEKTSFNIFSSQGDQKLLMQKTTMAVINRTIDVDIFSQLALATLTTGAAAPLNVGLFAKSQATLSANKVPWDGNITLVCSGAALGQLQLAPEFSSADYVGGKPNMDDPSWRDKPQAVRWRNVLIIAHPMLSNLTAPATEAAYMFHRNAIGHVANSGDMQSAVGYNEEDDYSYARTSIYMASKLLQNGGIIKINHDATGLYGG